MAEAGGRSVQRGCSDPRSNRRVPTTSIPSTRTLTCRCRCASRPAAAPRLQSSERVLIPRGRSKRYESPWPERRSRRSPRMSRAPIDPRAVQRTAAVSGLSSHPRAPNVGVRRARCRSVPGGRVGGPGNARIDRARSGSAILQAGERRSSRDLHGDVRAPLRALPPPDRLDPRSTLQTGPASSATTAPAPRRSRGCAPSSPTTRASRSSTTTAVLASAATSSAFCGSPRTRHPGWRYGPGRLLASGA